MMNFCEHNKDGKSTVLWYRPQASYSRGTCLRCHLGFSRFSVWIKVLA